jgi:hypothetical protein
MKDNRHWGGNDENFVRASDIQPEEPEKSGGIPSYSPNNQSLEVVAKTEGKCHKGEMMDENHNVFIVDGMGCQYDGDIIESLTVEADDHKGNKKRWEEKHYYCQDCLDTFEMRLPKLKERSFNEVLSDVEHAKERHRKNPLSVDKDRTSISWGSS